MSLLKILPSLQGTHKYVPGFKDMEENEVISFCQYLQVLFVWRISVCTWGLCVWTLVVPSSTAWSLAQGDSCQHGRGETGPTCPPGHLRADSVGLLNQKNSFSSQYLNSVKPCSCFYFYMGTLTSLQRNVDAAVLPVIALRQTRCVKETYSPEGLLK